MDLKFECPRCGQHLSATRVQIGVTAPCPNCNATVTVLRYLTHHDRQNSGKKTSRDHRDFNRERCGGTGQDQEEKKIGGRSRRGAELAYRSVKRDPCRQVCGGHFRSEDGRGHDAFKN
jgi:DNA-directed RNA polymerase subunit M/transcription elongation factor TFIIS